MKAMEKTEKLSINKSNMDQSSDSLKSNTRKQVSDMTEIYKNMEKDNQQRITENEKKVEEQEQ